MAGQSLGRLYVEIAANFAALQSSVDGLTRTTATKFSRMEGSVNRSLSSIEGRAQRMSNQVLAAFGTVSAIEMGKALSRVADNYANIEAKIKLATGGVVGLQSATDRVFSIANKTYSSFNSLSSLVTKTTRSLTGMGLEAKTAFELSSRLGEVVSKGLQLSGASAQETSSAVLQLSQALASGKLAGDEFRSFAENAPRLAQGVAEALGVTIGELRKLSKEGKLTTDVVVKALVDAGQTIDQEFSELPLTIGRAFTQLENEFTRFVGEGSQVTGVANAVARSIQLIAQNLGAIAGTGAAAGLVLVARSAGQVASSMAASANATYQAAEASRIAAAANAEEARTKNYMAVAEVRAAAATMDNVAAKAAYNAATSAIIQSERVALNSKLALLQADMAQVRGVIANAEAAGAQSFALRVVAEETARLASIQQAHAAVLNELAVLGTRDVANKEAQVVADNALAAAEERLAVARKAAAAAATQSATATAAATAATTGTMAAIRGLGSGLVAFLGGPVGATIVGLGALAYAMYELDAATVTAEEGVADLTAKYLEHAKKLRDASKDPVQLIDEQRVNYEKQMLDEYAATLAELKQLEQSWNGGMAWGETGAIGSDSQLVRMQQLKERAAELKAQLEGLNNAANEAYAAQKEADRANEARLEQFKNMAAGIQTVSDETDKGTKKQKSAFQALDKTIEQHQRTYNEWVSESVQGMAELEASLDPLIELEQWYTNAQNAMGEYLMSQKNEASAVERVKKNMALLNVEYSRRKREIEAQRSPHQQLLDDLDQEARLLMMTNEQRRVEQELTRVSAGMSPEQINTMRGEIAQRMAVIDAIEKQKEQHEELVRLVDQGSQQMSRSLYDFIRGEKDFSDMMDGMVDSVKDMVAQVIAEVFRMKVIKPFLEGIFNIGSSGGNGGGWMSMVGNFMGGGGGGGGMSQAGPWASGYQLPGTTSGGAGLFGGVELGPWMAGLAGAAYGLQNTGNGGLSTGLGAASYGALGVGAYGALSGAAGAYAATGSVFGAGGAVAGGMSGAAMALPVIGWIAAIAALVDLVAGGRLFGTRFKPESVTTSVGVGESGGRATASREEVRQRSLFRGRQWRTVQMDPTAEAVEAANQLFENVQTAMEGAANQLGVEVPDIVAGAFNQIYDDKGKLKEEFSQVLGKKYKEDFEAFQKRIIAENLIAVVDASIEAMTPELMAKVAAIVDPGDGDIGGGGRGGGGGGGGGGSAPDTRGEASIIADRWRADAEQLLEGAQFLVAAQKAIQEGVGLLRDGTLTATADIVEELQGQNESLVETYQRLYEQADVMRTSLELMGVQMFETDEEMVRFADGLTQAAGGLSNLKSLWDTYFKEYYDQNELAAVMAERTRASADAALAGIGLSTATTLEEARAAFEENLPTMSEAMVVKWLKALALLAEVTNATETAAEQAAAAMAAYDDFVAQFSDDGLTDFQRALRGIATEESKATAEAHRLARAAGMQGAAERDLANIHRWAANRASEALRALKTSVQDLISQLYGGAPGSLDELDRRIAELEAGGQQELSYIDEVAQANDDRYERELRAIAEISGWLESLMLGDLSTLNPQQMLAESATQFQMALARYQAGDVTALEDLTDYAQAYLEQARGFFGSNDQYTQIFDYVTGVLRAIMNAGPQSSPSNPTTGGGGPGVPVVTPELEELYRQRDEMMAQMEAANRLQLAQLLTEQLGDLAHALNVPVLELATNMGVSMELLVADLGINLEELTATTLEQLGAIANTLGVSLPELAESLEVPMRDLVEATGLSLDELTGETVMAMTAMARDLGMELTDLAESVDVALGSLADSQSLLNDALEQTIEGLPPDISDQLEPLLRAVEDATTEADANAAIAELEGAVNDLPTEYRDLLAPFFDNINPQDYREQHLGYLSDISDSNGTIAGILETSNEVLIEILEQLGGSMPPPEPPPAAAGEATMAGFKFAPDGSITYAPSGKAATSTDNAVLNKLDELINAVKESGTKGADSLKFAAMALQSRRG